MSKSEIDENRRLERRKVVTPSYGPGNSLYSTTDSLTARDIENYFRIVPNRSNSSISLVENSSSKETEQKMIQYLRPTSFEQQQKEMEKFTKSPIDIIPYATFHEKFVRIEFSLKRSLFFFFIYKENNIFQPIKKHTQKIINKDMIKNFYK